MTRTSAVDWVSSRAYKSYALGLAAVALVALFRWSLDPYLGDHHPFILFLVPVLLVAWFAGWRPASLVIAAAFLTADYCFLDPRGSFGPKDVEGWVGAFFFVSVSVVGVVLAELLRTEIANRQRTQEKLRQAQAQLEYQVAETSGQLRGEEARSRRLAALVASSEDGIIGLDPSYAVTDWNNGAELLFDLPAHEMLGKNILVLVPDEGRPAATRNLQLVAEGGHVEPYEAVRVKKGGDQVAVSVRLSSIRDQGGKFVGFSLIYRDLTKAKKLEADLRQSQKMEAIGQLAGGVAHDFNNILTVINGYSEILLERMEDDDPKRPSLEQILEAGQRAAALTYQLLAFSRKQILQAQAVNLNDTVRRSEKLLRRLIGEDIQLAAVLAPGLERVNVDPGQMEQVIMNLAVNARDAMPHGGKLTIETANVELDESYAQTRPEVRPGSYVVLSITDDGIGMDEETKAHIFEPFFTTKEIGQGTGLGLSTVHGIVKQSGGHIAVYSERSHGTSLKIYLPRFEGVREAAKTQSGSFRVPRGAETLLLVEDEDAVRTLARSSLESSGYTVLVASQGEEALRLAEAHAGKIHLLISDVVMPKMGGRLLAEWLTQLRPGIKVLFLSGYTDDTIVRHGVLEEGVAFLQKPFSVAMLARKVREVLDAP